MAEFISRAKAIRAIADCTIFHDRKVIEEECAKSISEENGWLGGIMDAMNAIDDVQEETIIRCKKCKYYREENPVDGYCDKLFRRVGNHWYCADGEPKN